MNVSSLSYPQGPSIAATTAGRPPEAANPAMREAFANLGKAIKSSDVPAARTAYAEMIRSAPEGTPWPKESAFSELGRALLTQDLPTARLAYAAMARNGLAAMRPHLPGGPSSPPSPAGTTASSTGGVAGTLVNISA